MGLGSSKNSTLGIVAKEKKLVIKSWKLLKPALAEHGAAIFVMYFNDYPIDLKYFPFGKDPSRLAQDPLLKQHAMRVMREINALVKNIHKQETLLYLLRASALNHRQRKITKRAYNELRLSFLKYLNAVIKPRPGKQDVICAWDHALTVMFGTITDINDMANCLCTKPNNENLSSAHVFTVE